MADDVIHSWKEQDVIHSWKEQYLIKKNIIYRKNHVKNLMESKIDFRLKKTLF